MENGTYVTGGNETSLIKTNKLLWEKITGFTHYYIVGCNRTAYSNNNNEYRISGWIQIINRILKLAL